MKRLMVKILVAYLIPIVVALTIYYGICYAMVLWQAPALAAGSTNALMTVGMVGIGLLIVTVILALWWGRFTVTRWGR